METLALIETLDRDGQPRQILRVSAWPVRIGRAIDNDLVLDDLHVAPYHATLTWAEDGVHVEPAATLNGVRFGRATVVAGTTPRLPASGLITLGAVTLRVRLAGDELPPEQLLVDRHHVERRHAAMLVALIVLASVWEAFDLWLTTVPGTAGTSLARTYLSAPLALVLWCAAWAVGSMLFLRRFAFWAHLYVALTWLLLGLAVETVAGQLAFAFSMPSIEKAGQVGFVLALAVMLWRHMGLLLPSRRRVVGFVIATAVAVSGALTLGARWVGQEPLVGSLYLGTISLPAVRLARPQSVDSFVKSAAPLQESLARWAKPGDGDDDDDTPPEGDDQ